MEALNLEAVVAASTVMRLVTWPRIALTKSVKSTVRGEVVEGLQKVVEALLESTKTNKNLVVVVLGDKVLLTLSLNQCGLTKLIASFLLRLQARAGIRGPQVPRLQVHGVLHLMFKWKILINLLLAGVNPQEALVRVQITKLKTQAGVMTSVEQAPTTLTGTTLVASVEMVTQMSMMLAVAEVQEEEVAEAEGLAQVVHQVAVVEMLASSVVKKVTSRESALIRVLAEEEVVMVVVVPATNVIKKVTWRGIVRILVQMMAALAEEEAEVALLVANATSAKVKVTLLKIALMMLVVDPTSVNVVMMEVLIIAEQEILMLTMIIKAAKVITTLPMMLGGPTNNNKSSKISMMLGVLLL